MTFLSFEGYHLTFAHFRVPDTWHRDKTSHSVNICRLNPTINEFISISFIFLSLNMTLKMCHQYNKHINLILENLSHIMEETCVPRALLMFL